MGSDPETHPLPISVSSVVKILDMDGRSRMTATVDLGQGGKQQLC
jgi:hypothetical protein